MKTNKSTTRWLGAYCGAMLYASASFAVPEINIKDIAAFPSGIEVENLIEGNHGEVYGLTKKNHGFNNPVPLFDDRLFKIDVQGNYSDVLVFSGDAVVSSLKGADNQLYLLIQKPDSYKLYRVDIDNALPQPVLVYDFGAKDITNYCPVSNISPINIYQKPDGTFVVGYRHFADSYIDRCAYGVSTLDLSGPMPMLKNIYEVVPLKDRADLSALEVTAFLSDQQGKYYSLLRDNISRIGEINDFVQEIDTNLNPAQEKMLHIFPLALTRNSLVYSVLSSANGKFYGVRSTDFINLSGTGELSADLFELDPSKNFAYNAVKSFTSSISLDPVTSNLVYSQDYPNSLQDFIKADKAGNYFFGTRGVVSGSYRKLLFRLDNTSTTPVYQEFQDVHIPSEVNELKFFLNNTFYGYKYEYAGGLASKVLTKVEITGTDLLPPVNTAPTAVSDSFKIHQKGKKPVTVAAPGLLKNDTDADGDKLSIIGTAPGKPKIIPVHGKNGKIEIHSDGKLIYFPPKGKSPRVVSFSYQTSDGKAVSNTAIVTLKINTEGDC